MPIARLVGACLLLMAAANVAEAQLRAQPYVSGLSMPLAIVTDPRDRTVQFVVEQAGRIRVVQNGELQNDDFLDIRSAVLCCGERGLFSLVFPPDAATSNRFYVNFTREPDGHTVVARFLRTADPLVADPSSRVDLVWPDGRSFIEQPFPNHNGGHMAFGPDGFLYIGLGDGGAGDDPGHRAQDPETLLGKMLRIDVNVPEANSDGYVVPLGNPFVNSQPITALTEIWSFGWRNPWRFSFDDPALGGTGALVVGDVGQNNFEEIDYEPAGRGGRNYGWRNREGKHATPGIPTSPGPAYTPLTDPIFDYSHNGGGASITGGYVYRGSALGPEFVGRYFFADFVLSRQWSIALTVNPTTHEATASDLREHTAEFGAVGGVSSFGVDPDGELFIIDYGGAIYRILPQDPPNLRVTTVTVPATGVAGGTINIANRIENAGGVTAVGPFQVGFYLSSSSTPGTGRLIGSRSVASLKGVGPLVTTAVTVPPDTAPGSYFVSAVVDIDETVDESDEGDNGLTAATKVDIIRPDLAMLSVSGPTRGAVGQPISVSTSVKNVGPLSAGAFTIGIYLSSTNTPGSGTRIATRAVAGLAPGATNTAATSANIPQGTAPATYFLSAVADDGQVVLETGDAANGTNGANNAAVAAAPLQVVSLLPDLEIASISAPATMGLGRPMTVAFTVRNSGLTAAGSFRVRFYLAPEAPPPNPGDGVEVGVRAFTSLAAGASLATSVSVTVPSNLNVVTRGPALYFVSAVADADGQVAEIVEGVVANGRLATEIRLIRPDLQVVRLETTASPAVAKAARGGTLVLRNVTVKNTATTPGYAPASTLKFYLSDDQAQGAGDVELTPVVSVPALAPGASFFAAPTLSIPATVTTGAKFIVARVFALSSLTESDPFNNTRAVPLEIGDFADLQITAVAGPAAAGTGLPMTVSFTTRNAGTAPVGPFRVNLFMAPGPNPPTVPGGTDVGSKDFSGLAAGASLASTLIVNVPANFAAGSYFLSAVADDSKAIPEADGNDGAEANGLVAIKTINVIRPDLAVSALTGPIRAARGGTAAVTATVKNLAAAPAAAPASSLKFYLSDNQTLDGTDVELSPARAIPTLGPGAISTATTTLIIPASVTTGSKFILARADAPDQVIEAQDGNNVRAWAIEIGDFADLKITAVAGPAAAGTGRPMTVSFTTRNDGVAPVGPFRVSLFLAAEANPAPEPGDGDPVGFKDFLGLAAGASLASTLVIDLPADFVAGSYVLSAVADSGNAIRETNDGFVLNGKVAAKTINVIRPDLVVSALTGPGRAARGGTVAVTATVKNIAASPATAPASSLKFYLSDDQTFDGTDVELSPVRTAPVRTVPALAASGVSTAVTILTIPGSVTTGNKFILARADALDQVIEAEEANNITARAIEIGDFADLKITAVAGPATVRAGQNMTVSFTVKNAGTAPVGAFDVTVYLAPAAPPPAPGDGDAVGLKTIKTLGTLASLATTVVVTVPDDLAPGVYALSVVADADGTIPELGGHDGLDANGKLATKTISVQPPL